MEIQNFDKWNLLGYEKQIRHEQLQRVADSSKMKERDIKTDTVSFSKEGMSALHGQFLPGQVDVEEMKRMHEILPKLKYNPADDYRLAMQKDMQNSLNAIKEKKGSYTLDDLLSIRMDAYAKQYDALQQSYKDGTREIYVSDGLDENGKLQYHKVTQEEDFAYLDEAFERITGTMVFSAKSQEIMLEIKEKFGGEQIEIDLPKDYDKKLVDILEKAASSYKELKSQGKEVNASQLVLKFFNEDKDYANVMRKLYSLSMT